jgi:imidazole glycerol phosphate synthase subunit HisF
MLSNAFFRQLFPNASYQSAAFGRYVDAALAASIFHYKTDSVDRVKEYLKENGVPVRI